MRNTNKKILIVDSNDAFRATLGDFIKGLGHEVFEGATGPEAIDKASSLHPDLIMMDVRLPGMNGDEVTARLKSNRLTRNIPVVIKPAGPPPATLKSASTARLMQGRRRFCTSHYNFQCCAMFFALIYRPSPTRQAQRNQKSTN